MRMEKKRILKEDGRYLVYYHFPDTAAPEETAAFAEVHPVGSEAEQRLAADAPTADTSQPINKTSQEQARV